MLKHRTTLAIVLLTAVFLLTVPLISLTALPTVQTSTAQMHQMSTNFKLNDKPTLGAASSILPETVDELILVPCHAIYLDDSADPWKESSWLLQAYQKQSGQLSAFVKHIEHGYQLLAEQPAKRLLLFSGGQTSYQAGPQSEAQGYYRALRRLLQIQKQNSSGGDKLLLQRQVATEDFARDSFENLLFAVCRFHEMTGGRRYPSSITVVGLEFKRKRFMELHRAALRFPLQQFNYVGIDGDGTAIPTLINSELENAYRPFSSDPYGCFDQKLTGKRKQRDPYLQFSGRLGYSQSCPAIAGLLQHCSRDIYNGQLPWR